MKPLTLHALALTAARKNRLATIMMGTSILVGPGSALAAATTTIDLPIITEVACPVLQWMQGPLGVIIFLAVVVATLVIGMIARMDWSRIITVTVILAILVGLGGIVANVASISAMTGVSSCLM